MKFLSLYITENNEFIELNPIFNDIRISKKRDENHRYLMQTYCNGKFTFIGNDYKKLKSRLSNPIKVKLIENLGGNQIYEHNGILQLSDEYNEDFEVIEGSIEIINEWQKILKIFEQTIKYPVLLNGLKFFLNYAGISSNFISPITLDRLIFEILKTAGYKYGDNNIGLDFFGGKYIDIGSLEDTTGLFSNEMIRIRNSFEIPKNRTIIVPNLQKISFENDNSKAPNISLKSIIAALNNWCGLSLRLKDVIVNNNLFKKIDFQYNYKLENDIDNLIEINKAKYKYIENFQYLKEKKYSKIAYTTEKDEGYFSIYSNWSYDTLVFENHFEKPIKSVNSDISFDLYKAKNNALPIGITYGATALNQGIYQNEYDRQVYVISAFEKISGNLDYLYLKAREIDYSAVEFFNNRKLVTNGRVKIHVITKQFYKCGETSGLYFGSTLICNFYENQNQIYDIGNYDISTNNRFYIANNSEELEVGVSIYFYIYTNNAIIQGDPYFFSPKRVIENIEAPEKTAKLVDGISNQGITVQLKKSNDLQRTLTGIEFNKCIGNISDLSAIKINDKTEIIEEVSRRYSNSHFSTLTITTTTKYD